MGVDSFCRHREIFKYISLPVQTIQRDMFNQYRVLISQSTSTWKRYASTCPGSDKFKILIVGAGVSLFYFFA